MKKNIREYLGKNLINKGIIDTLKNKNDRNNFFYYNNGVTIICNRIDTQGRTNTIELFQPQIVNGCQTVNSIFEVLTDYSDQDINHEFKQTFVIVKVLLLMKKLKNLADFYRDIVKFTNKQNSIKETAFGARQKIFSVLQKELKDRGFSLLVKPSDKNIFNKKIFF